MITKQTIHTWLTDGAEGFDYSPVPESVEVMADPQVDGTYAARFADEDGTTVDLLFVTASYPADGLTDAQLIEQTLEEVEYETWPPRSGSLRFF